MSQGHHKQEIMLLKPTDAFVGMSVGPSSKRYLLTDCKVILPGAGIPEVSEVLLEPDLQVECRHFMPCRLQELQGHAAVHSPT